ncbi:MAG: ParB/RepB/Spo0J family partition protein [Alphaproteobacteria bacterium]|nr:ParB/RepB/Spo0J family partition protein [Alphaproteobacteria bacterium]
MSAARRQPLGRGLSALFGGVEGRPPPDSTPARDVPIESIRPGTMQPRRHFDQNELEGLAQSIRDKGLLQPLLVRPIDDDSDATFEIVAGERRWRAAQRAGLHAVPVLVRELGDREALEIALIENLQRDDLTSIEEAEAYRRLTQEFGRTQAAVAEALGKSRSHVANTMRLLGLPEAVRQYLETGLLSAGHGRALLGADEPGRLAAEIMRRGLNVRATEQLVKRRTVPRQGSARRAVPGHDADTVALERDLSRDLGLRVTIAARPRGGSLTLHYASLDQLDRLIALLRAG